MDRFTGASIVMLSTVHLGGSWRGLRIWASNLLSVRQSVMHAQRKEMRSSINVVLLSNASSFKGNFLSESGGLPQFVEKLSSRRLSPIDRITLLTHQLRADQGALCPTALTILRRICPQPGNPPHFALAGQILRNLALLLHSTTHLSTNHQGRPILHNRYVDPKCALPRYPSARYYILREQATC